MSRIPRASVALEGRDCRRFLRATRISAVRQPRTVLIFADRNGFAGAAGGHPVSRLRALTPVLPGEVARGAIDGSVYLRLGGVPEGLQKATPGSDRAVLISSMGTPSHFSVIPPSKDCWSPAGIVRNSWHPNRFRYTGLVESSVNRREHVRSLG